jgi:hypothetical protein
MKNNDNQKKKSSGFAIRISAVALVAAFALLLPASSQASTTLPFFDSSYHQKKPKTKVPEPSLLLMLGTGVSGLELLRRRFKKN